MEEATAKVTARIMGEDYTIRGRAPREHIERIARYVDEKMLQISEAYPKLGTSRVAVLAAINMADELFKIKEQYEQLTRLLEEEWSERHAAAAAAAEVAATSQRRPSPGRTPSAQMQLSAFGEPVSATQVLLTGDALPVGSRTEADPAPEPGELPEDEDQ